jgi:selenide,water dikinase
MRETAPVIKDLVLIGGGHSHITVLKAFGMNPIPGVRVTLVSRDMQTPYSGMLPGLIAGHYTPEEAHIDLAPLTRFANARFIRDRVTGLDPDRRLVELDDRPPLSYDILSINSGSTPSTDDVRGADDHAVLVKPISQFLDHWHALKARIDAREAPLTITVVGGGAGSVELILAAQYALAPHEAMASGTPALKFVLLTADAEILATHPTGIARRFRRILSERGIDVYSDARAREVRANCVVDSSGREYPTDETLWVTHAGAPEWLRKSGLAVDDAGFLCVDDHLRSTSHGNIFGAGDVATMIRHPRPKAGVFAVRQGRPLLRNLSRALLERSLIAFRPQRRFLTLISTGNRYAVASRNFWSAEGEWVWHWKDRIDRRFMRRFQELPNMTEPSTTEVPRELSESVKTGREDDGMRCGGCGAKVAADVLSEALRDLEPVDRDDVIIGLDAPDDAAMIAQQSDKVSVLSIDAFRPMVDDPYLFGKITANHCLGDIYAMGAEPQSAMTIATLPVWPEEKLIDELRHMLLGALAVFRESGTALVGGHTSEGAEISLGFSVTGLIERERALHKTGLNDGDALILTKAIGTGTILAADMRAKASGAWVDAALASMLLSNQSAGRILRANGATACTDITGFGLAGHLLEMLGDTKLAATVYLKNLPIIAGALTSVDAGLMSTLQPDNERFGRRIEASDPTREDAAFALLFDPQTAGGLLAGVPGDRVDDCLDELRRDGYTSVARIGEVLATDDINRPLRILSG